MSSAVNGIYVLQGVSPAQIASAPVGVKVVETYNDNGVLFSKAQVAQMESGGGKVLGYFSLGEAENYRSYWPSLPKSILGPQDPSWPGDYEVAYWTPQWLSVAESSIQTMINQGYNGAFFDVVDEAFTSWAKQHAPNGNPQGAMITLIQELANYAHARNPNFQIWINSSGAEPMLAKPALVGAINGAYEEQLFYQTPTQATNSADLAYNVSLLDNITKAGKPVVAVEYVSGSTEVANVEAKARADGFGYYIANPNEELDGVDTQGFAGLTKPAASTATAGAASPLAASSAAVASGAGAAGPGADTLAKALAGVATAGGAAASATGGHGLPASGAGSGLATVLVNHAAPSGDTWRRPSAHEWRLGEVAASHAHGV